MMAKITDDTILSEMMKKHPETVDVLRKYRLNCFGCMGAERESLRNVSVYHGIDLERFLRDLNNVIKK